MISTAIGGLSIGAAIGIGLFVGISIGFILGLLFALVVLPFVAHLLAGHVRDRA